MSDTSSDRPWVLRGIAIVAVFVFLNQVLGTGTTGGLLAASWGKPLTWGVLLLGVLVSVFIVEVFRRASWKSPKWFVEVFGIIGAYVVIADFLDTLLAPALDAVLTPVFHTMPTWMMLVLLVVMGAIGALVISMLINRYWGNEGTTERT